MMTQYHNPVLLKETLKGLKIKSEGVYVDVTYGGGGHSKEIIGLLGESGRLFGFDQDNDAFANRIDDPRFEFIAANFSHLNQYLKYHGVKFVDGILADFGVSSYQFDNKDRGFSIRNEGRLDMRMNQSQNLDAFHVLNEYSKDAISKLLFNYGDLRNSKKIAEIIFSARGEYQIETTKDLINLLMPIVPMKSKNKFLARIFQAIRIEVNDELRVLKAFLKQSAEILRPGGRLVCISYHSLEDRLVKRFIKSGNFEGKEEKDFFGNSLSPLFKIEKLKLPSQEEIKNNSRARSAKLRIGEKK
jgi:16S rRNA (cytosine1402-N4)-methyltransferase